MSYLAKDPAALLPREDTRGHEREAAAARWNGLVERRWENGPGLMAGGYVDPLAARLLEIEASLTVEQMREEYRWIRDLVAPGQRALFVESVAAAVKFGTDTRPARWVLEARKAAPRYRKIGEF